jgi:hypothetical protein
VQTNHESVFSKQKLLAENPWRPVKIPGNGKSKNYRIQVIRPVIVGKGDCLFMVAGELVFTLSVVVGVTDIAQVINIHEIGSFNGAAQFSQSDFRSSE